MANKAQQQLSLCGHVPDLSAGSLLDNGPFLRLVGGAMSETRSKATTPRYTSSEWAEMEVAATAAGQTVQEFVRSSPLVRARAGAPTVAPSVNPQVTQGTSTDEEVTAAVARHAGQLNLYRRVVAVLSKLSAGRVECCLVFTRLRRIERVLATS
jgi:hypothetical protein